MALSVHTDALPGLSAQLRRAAEDSRQTKAHLARCDTGALGGFLSSMIKPDAAYADLASPQGRLCEPGDYSGDLTWQISITSDLTNLVSPVRALCEVIFGVDPVELIVGRLLCGDWKEFRRTRTGSTTRHGPAALPVQSDSPSLIADARLSAAC